METLRIFSHLGPFCLVVILCLNTSCESKKVLLISPSVGSHLLLMTSIAEPLMAKGHEVHMILNKRTKIASSIVSEGIKVVYYDTGVEPIFQMEDYQRSLMSIETTANLSGGEKYRLFKQWLQYFSDTCNRILTNEDLIGVLSREKYDIAVTNSMIRCYLHLPYKLGIPFVSLTSMLYPDVTAAALQSPYLVQGPIDEIFATRGRKTLTTVEKLVKVLIHQFFIYYSNQGFDVYTKDQLSLADIQRKSVLWLLDINHLLDNQFPVSPNVIRVGGLNIREPKPIADATLKQFADSAIEGFVYVSFGSFAKYLPEEVTATLLDSLSEIPHKVILKWDIKLLKGRTVPKNILIMNWLPQNDLLGHKNIKVFVTHCGNNGQHEALYNGVPMAGIPLFGDQVWNAIRMTDRGFGDFIRVRDLTTVRLTNMINKVIQNQSYFDSIQSASRVFRAQPMTPRDTAAFWIDHVMEYGGDHLRSVTSDLPWCELLMFDVLFLVLFCFAVFLLLLVLIARCCCRFCLKRQQRKKEKQS